MPSGLKATADTGPSCPLRVARASPVAASHSRTVPSLPAEARVLPSGLKATAFTQPSCPLRVARASPVAASHSRTV